MAKDDSRSSGSGGSSIFASTHWSQVFAAKGGESPESIAAREKLCGAYWYPLYVYARRWGCNPEDARDATQEFFYHFLRDDAFRLPDPARGKFRAFLQNRMNRFLIDEWRKGNAQKRGGRVDFIPLDTTLAEERYCAEPGEGTGIGSLFDQKWALVAMDRALDHLKKEYGEKKKALFEELRPLLTGELDEAPCQAIAEKLRKPVGTIKAEVYRIRLRFSTLFRAEISETVDPDEVDEELRYLISIVGK